ncbi:MAG: EscI/YscI/HrpB family type III secretion system inner rod protein [Planctomycetota bacterium]|jgi:hypothetical protein|nr:EscI/YscI/HrpB family type III secretion system inner rod protein [Planctomycetota bacterium]
MSIGIGGNPSALGRQQALEAVEKVGRDTASPGAPGKNDVEKFQAAMDRPGMEKAGPPLPAAVQPTTTAEPASMGDRILRGISSAGEKIQAGRAEAISVLGKENLSQADLLRANFSLMESSTLVSAVSKTTEKITQGVKTLQQG